MKKEDLDKELSARLEKEKAEIIQEKTQAQENAILLKEFVEKMDYLKDIETLVDWVNSKHEEDSKKYPVKFQLTHGGNDYAYVYELIAKIGIWGTKKEIMFSVVNSMRASKFDPHIEIYDTFTHLQTNQTGIKAEKGIDILKGKMIDIVQEER